MLNKLGTFSYRCEYFEELLNISLRSPPLSKRRYCVIQCVSVRRVVYITYRLHATMVSAAKVLHCGLWLSLHQVAVSHSNTAHKMWTKVTELEMHPQNLRVWDALCPKFTKFYAVCFASDVSVALGDIDFPAYNFVYESRNYDRICKNWSAEFTKWPRGIF